VKISPDKDIKEFAPEFVPIFLDISENFLRIWKINHPKIVQKYMKNRPYFNLKLLFGKNNKIAGDLISCI